MADPTDPYPGIPRIHPDSGRVFADGERRILFETRQKLLAQGGGRHRDPLAPPPAPAQDDTVTFEPLDEGELDEAWDRETERRRGAPTTGSSRAHRAEARPAPWEGMAGRLRDRSHARKAKAMGGQRLRVSPWLVLLALVVGFTLGALVATAGIIADPTILPGNPAPVPTVTFVPPVEVPAQ